MSKSLSRLLVFAMAAGFAIHPLVAEAVPALFTHQGRLKDSSGTLVTGAHVLTFRLYDAASGGTVQWTLPVAVTLSSGLYTVNLPIPVDTFDGAPYWMSVQVDSDPELTERMQIASVPYAARAATAAIGGGWEDLGAAVALADSTNAVGIGTSAPARRLHVVAPPGDLFAARFESAHPGATVTEIKNSSNDIIWEHSVAGSDGAFGGFVPSGSMYFYRQGSPVIAAVIDSNGNTGLGELSTDARLHVAALEGQTPFQVGIDVESNNALGIGIGVNVNAGGSSSNYGVAAATGGGDLSVAVLGQAFSSADDAYGVSGYASADSVAYGVYGEAANARTNYGVVGKVTGNGTNTAAVRAEATKTFGVSSGSGPVGILVRSEGENCWGIESRTSGNYSMPLQANATGNGSIGAEIITQGDNTIALRATDVGSNGYAASLQGDVQVFGTLTKGGGAFKIDHPLDPANKYLQHSFVESPDMKNIYDGIVVTDASGRATVVLPDWFGSLNGYFRYQLTVIGDFAQAVISEEISDNRFAIRTDKPNVKVSWQVTGIRKDAFANANRIEVEVAKAGDERDRYLYPEALGLDESRGMDYERIQRIISAAPPPAVQAPGTRQ